MLIIVSDLHLGDGTCGKSISASAFELFADRLQEMADNASQRAGGRYRPLESIDILLLGDILDPLHSTLWLDKVVGEPGYARPWTDTRAPEFAQKVGEITQAILKNNAEAAGAVRRISQGNAVRLLPADRRGRPAGFPCRPVSVPVHLYYLSGNHDWYYHLSGPAFDDIRKKIIHTFGLANSPSPFPYEAGESGEIRDLLNRYKVQARHGDFYDSFNFDKAKGRDASSLGDVFSMEVINRFPLEVKKRLGDDIPASIVNSLRELTNVRPALATPLWISGQLRQNNVPDKEQRKLKAVWNELCDEFLEQDFVRKADRRFKLDIVDGLEMLVKITKRASFKTLDEVVVWLRQKMWSGEISFAQNALKEEAFLKRSAQFIVYGHTHHYEVVPLDSIPTTPSPTNQMYLNSGTWHTYYDLAVYKPEEQKFIPYQVVSYLAFFTNDELGGRRFETWSGAFSD